MWRDRFATLFLALCAVEAGSWGDVPCDVSVDVYSSTALQVSFSKPATAYGWTPSSVCFFLQCWALFVHF